jgi:hypothetical protein
MTALTVGIGQERVNKAGLGERNGHNGFAPAPEEETQRS